MPVFDLPPRPAPHTPRWVRVTRERPDGFVEFDFAIGSPDLAVDLILPRAAFEAFCAENRVRLIDDALAAALEAEQDKWRYGRAGLNE